MAYVKQDFTSGQTLTAAQLNNIEVGLIALEDEKVSLSDMDDEVGKIISITKIVDAIYPIGSIYMGINNVNPSTLFGGTWEQITDTFLLAASDITSASPTYIGGATGGEAEHVLTIDEIPAHTHTYSKPSYRTIMYAGSSTTGTTGASSTATSSTGGGLAHNNMPPYLAVYVWRRTA